MRRKSENPEEKFSSKISHEIFKFAFYNKKNIWIMFGIRFNIVVSCEFAEANKLSIWGKMLFEDFPDRFAPNLLFNKSRSDFTNFHFPELKLLVLTLQAWTMNGDVYFFIHQVSTWLTFSPAANHRLKFQISLRITRVDYCTCSVCFRTWNKLQTYHLIIPNYCAMMRVVHSNWKLRRDSI